MDSRRIHVLLRCRTLSGPGVSQNILHRIINPLSPWDWVTKYNILVTAVITKDGGEKQLWYLDRVRVVVVKILGGS